MPDTKAHPSPEQLSAYNLGQLPPDEASTVESHISECEPCCDTIMSLSSDDTFVGILKEARQLPPDQTSGQDAVPSPSSCQEVPAQLAQHPRYEIVRLIGKGGMGDVYEARHRKMERRVALKVINRGLVQKAEAIDRFHREVKAAARLSHPNIVTSHDADQAGDFHFMVMEFVDGVDLSQVVKAQGALPIADACDYIRQAAIGLQHAHECGMVHRDIKPHNLMVTKDGTVKILDFGLASLAPDAIPASDAVAANSDLTAAGAIMGTPDFISPEQAHDARQVDIRSDIYSLGATLYYLLSGRVPFDDGSVMHKLRNLAHVEPEALDSVRNDVPEELVTIVSRMMAKDPNERYLTPKEVAEALESFARARQEEIAESSLAHQVQPRRWKPTFLSLTAIAVLFVAALFAGLVYYVQTDYGVVRVVVIDPSLEVSIKDHTITMKDGDGKPLTIRPGEQSLIVRKDDADFEFETDSFQIRRGDKIAFKVEYINGEVVVRKDGEQFDSKTLSDDIEVRQILDRMEKAYAECKSYRDSGVIKSVFPSRTTGREWTVEHSFTTAFERPDRFRFEIKDQYDDELLISLDGEDVQTSWDIEPGFPKPESLKLAMPQAVGFTGGDVGRIPAMLMPKQLDGWVDLNLIDPIQIEDGKLQNVECFRLQYNFRDEQITLWIDKQSHLVRRIDEWRKSDDVSIERTTTYDPTIDGKITDEMLEFDPPAPRAADVSANMLPGSDLATKNSPTHMAQEQDADAATRKAGQQRSDNQFDMPLCWCPAGEFKMGRKQLPVTLTRGFWMGKYEVTQAQYEALMGENPSENKGESLPVEKVEWTKATKFCQKFTELERKAGRLPKGWEYRLPTDAQWEYACRAGTTLIWDEKDLVYPSTFGDDLSELGDYAWYSENCDGTPHPGGQKKPNAWGLCDMHGNVSEWVRDAWQSKLTGGKDPEVDVSFPIRTLRGGNWLSYAEPCGSPFTRGFVVGGREVPHMMGFRVALVSVGNSSDSAATDHKLLQGDWNVIAFTQDGKREFAADQGVGVLVQIKGDTITRIQTAPNGEKSEKEWGRIELNTTMNPKSIDIVNPDAPGGRLLGIFELKDGVLKLCFAEQRDIDVAEGQPLKRPITFDAAAGTDIVLLECRRAVESPDLKQLQGDWEAASITERGKQLSAEDGFGGLMLQIKGNTFVIAEKKPDGEKSEVDTGRIEINSTASPKTIDFLGRAEPTIGIYEFKDGALRVCVVEDSGAESPRGERIPDTKPLKRPTTFDSPVGSNIMLMEFTRSESAQEHDVSNIQGTWQVTYSEDGGRIAPQEMLKQIRFVIDEQNLTTEIGGRKSVSTYILDPSTNPKSIDLTENGRTKQAIYDLVGDTLRICIAESGEQRPTAFDSQPNSANDIVLILKRVKPDNASADGTEDQKHNGPLSEELARSLIPTAASISNEDFQQLQTNPAAETIKNKSLSLVLMTLDIGDQPPEAANDFRFLVEGYPKPSEIAAAMSPSRSNGYFSIIQPDYITECKITNSTDEIAQGKVTFNAPRLYIGSATFEARKHDGTWQIETFHLPSRQISIVLGEDGNWQLEGKEAEENQAPDPSDAAPDETPESPMSNTADVESLPLVQVLNDAEGLNDDQSLAPSNSQPGNVDLPRLAISPDITSLVWVDVRKLTTEKIQQSLASLLDAAPPEKRAWANEVIAQCRRRARPGFTALEKGMEAGIEVLVMGEKTNPASAVAADVEDALDFVQNALTAIELGLDAEDFDAEVPEPVDSKTGQLFVRMRPDTNPEDAIAIMVETFMTEARVTPGSEEAQALEQVKAMEFVEIGDSWFAVKGEKMVQPRVQALDTTPFLEALEKHKGAAIRFAWLMDDETRAEFDRAQLESGALSFGGLLTSLQEMQSTSGGIWLGQRPEIALDMEFANQEDAQLFKATFEKLLSSVGRIAAIGTDNPEEKLQAEQIRAGLSLMFLDRDEARLSKTFDSALLQRLTAAGLPWTRLFEPDSADESEKSDVVSEPPAGSIETPADEKRSPGVENDR